MWWGDRRADRQVHELAQQCSNNKGSWKYMWACCVVSIPTASSLGNGTPVCERWKFSRLAFGDIAVWYSVRHSQGRAYPCNDSSLSCQTTTLKTSSLQKHVGSVIWFSWIVIILTLTTVLGEENLGNGILEKLLSGREMLPFGAWMRTGTVWLYDLLKGFFKRINDRRIYMLKIDCSFRCFFN